MAANHHHVVTAVARDAGLSRRFGAVAIVGALAGVLAVPAAAAATGRTLIATAANINTVLGSARAGDTVELQGNFTSQVRLHNRDFGGVTINASGATLVNGMLVQNVQNINITGGTFGNVNGNTTSWHAIDIMNSSHISVANARFVGNNDTTGAGLRLLNSNFATVRDNSFSGNNHNLTIMNSNNNLVARNRFHDAGSDGIQLVSSQRTIIAHNSCTGFSPGPTAHPDCIQMWTDPNMSLTSTVYVLNNYMQGPQQGIFMGGGLNTVNYSGMTIAGNFLAGSKPHGISCYGCVNSLIEDNVVATLPNAQHRGWVRTFGINTGTQLDGNAVFDLRGEAGPIEDLLPTWAWTDLTPSIGGLVGSQNDSRDWRARATSSAAFMQPVPEPTTWLLLGMGFALIGRQLRMFGAGRRLRVQMA